MRPKPNCGGDGVTITPFQGTNSVFDKAGDSDHFKLKQKMWEVCLNHDKNGMCFKLNT